MDDMLDKTNLSQAPIVIEPWVIFGDLMINSHFFKRGILMISPKLNSNNLELPVDQSIKIKDREFVFHTRNLPSTVKPDSRAVSKSTTLLSSLVNFAQNKFNKKTLSVNNEVYLFNKKRREELFLPLLLGDETLDMGMYLFPWLTKSNHQLKDFQGFSQFITAGCMFGANMQAITEDGDSIELINHQIRLKPGQRIQKLEFDSQPTAFELMLFDEFKKSCLLINATSKNGVPKKLLFHLPCVDYMLFGLGLYIREQMSKDALDTFIRAIITREKLYHQVIGSMCQNHQIEVTFRSPFDNLFKIIDPGHPTSSLLEQILPKDSGQIINEELVVASCAKLLQSNNLIPAQRQVWEDFLKLQTQPVTTFEGLFKIGNAVLLATGARGKTAYECCSLLPLSEKQIPLQYELLSQTYAKNNPSTSPPYPAVFCLTSFEPVVTYSPTTSGLLFYFATCLNSLKTLMIDKGGLLHAARNVSLFGSSEKKQTESNSNSSVQTPVPFESILEESKKL